MVFLRDGNDTAITGLRKHFRMPNIVISAVSGDHAKWFERLGLSEALYFLDRHNAILPTQKSVRRMFS